MDFQVRRISPNEGLQLREVRLAALADAPHAFAATHAESAKRPYSAWSDRATTDATSSISATFFGVNADGDIVGLAGGFRRSEEDSEIQLVSMWVAPSARGHGLATALVKAVVGWAEGLSVQAVHLWVTRGNFPAEALYTENGFVPSGDVQPLPSDPCQDELAMRRVL